MKSSPRSPVRTALSMAACLALHHGALHAQVAPDTPETPSTSTADPADGITRIVVTAQKRAQFAEKVPMSLSALSGDQLQKQGVSDMLDLGRLSPGLSVSTSNSLGQPNISIRGISSQSGAATTALYIDDAPIQARTLSNLIGGSVFPQVFDLQRVEVLRGPQGTLFGSSAQGGAIRFITPMPRSTDTNGEARFGVGATQGGALSYDTGLAVGGSVDGSESALFRVSLGHRREGGYTTRIDRDTREVVDRNSNPRDASVMRAALQWQPDPAWTITPAVFLQETNDRDRNVYYEEAGVFKTFNKIRQPTRDRFSLSSLSVGYETDAVNFKSITSQFDRRQNRVDDFSYTNGAIYLSDEVIPGFSDYVALNRMVTTQRNLAQEFRLSSNDAPSARSSWVAGVYFSRAKLTAEQSTAEDLDRFANAIFGAPASQLPDIFSSGPVGPNNEFSYLESDRLNDHTKAIFGEYTQKIGVSTTAVVGLRLGRNDYSFSSLQQGAFAPNGLTLVQGRKRDDSVLPKVSLSHEFSKTDMLYATAASGDRPGGGNPALAGYVACQGDMAALGIKEVKPDFDADKLWSYELGYKARLLDQSLEVAASLFYIDWKNIQTRIILPSCQFGFMTNAGKARSTGADLQLQWRLSPRWSLSASASLTDAKYLTTVFADGSESGAGSPVVRSGQALPAPRVTANLGLEYGWKTANGYRAFVRGDYQYASAYKRTGAEGSFDHDAGVFEAPSTQFVSLNAGLNTGSYEWNVSILNLTNSQTQLLRYRYTPTDPSFQATTFRPRTVSASVTYKF